MLGSRQLPSASTRRDDGYNDENAFAMSRSGKASSSSLRGGGGNGGGITPVAKKGARKTPSSKQFGMELGGGGGGSGTTKTPKTIMALGKNGGGGRSARRALGDISNRKNTSFNSGTNEGGGVAMGGNGKGGGGIIRSSKKKDSGVVLGMSKANTLQWSKKANQSVKKKKHVSFEKEAMGDAKSRPQGGRKKLVEPIKRKSGREENDRHGGGRPNETRRGGVGKTSNNPADVNVRGSRSTMIEGIGNKPVSDDDDVSDIELPAGRTYRQYCHLLDDDSPQCSFDLDFLGPSTDDDDDETQDPEQARRLAIAAADREERRWQDELEKTISTWDIDDVVVPEPLFAHEDDDDDDQESLLSDFDYLAAIPTSSRRAELMDDEIFTL